MLLLDNSGFRFIKKTAIPAIAKVENLLSVKTTAS